MKLLAFVSLAQLVLQAVAARRAIRERIPYDNPLSRGKPEDVARDMWTSGSGLAAPWPFIAVHAAGTVLLLVKPRPVLRRMVGWLGALYIVGISWERVSRESLRHPDTKTTPLIVAGLVLSTAMAWLGLRGRTHD
jgi:hypothetical protein